ncbi:MAG: threonine synthase [Candidatus Diapherotrites archaeon]|nr:threonine synthase [Candidatus Diapherotrites archaeon]
MTGSKINYYSTNRNSEPVDFKEALMRGQAEDKGLYLPDRIPKISSEMIDSMKDMSYPDIAFTVTREFLKDDIDEADLKSITRSAYNFDIPLEKVFGSNYLLRMDRGPTASFKDFAARMLARLMQHYSKDKESELVVLTATSGDTGSAVANAFFGMDNIRVVVLFPRDEVSDRQRKQMTTLGKNISAIAVDGKFDDCQAMVKKAFCDKDLESIDMTSANSINFGRLVPQSVYYFYCYSRVVKSNNEKMVFSVPSGNFGNLTGGILAKKMGLPVHKFVVSVNENDEFPKFLETGNYSPILPSKACLSSAMNVGHPSNFARIIDFYGGQIDEKGSMVKAPDMNLMKHDLYPVTVSDNETVMTINNVYNNYGVVLEPHGAVSWAGLEHFLSETSMPVTAVSFETAHPAKFNSKLNEILGIEVDLPESMRGLENKNESFESIPADYGTFKKFLKTSF